MGTRLNAQDASAYEALDRLLYREWDPIGLYDSGCPEDEYREYLPDFWRLVTTHAEPEVIADYLGQTEAGNIGIGTSPEHRLDIARKAIALLAVWRMDVRG